MKHGKRLTDAYKAINHDQVHGLIQALEILKAQKPLKFDQMVELGIQLNVDSRKADQNMRGVFSLPHGTGKTVRVAVFAKGPKAEEAKNAGADIVGSDDLVAQIQAGEIKFDRCIATPDMMAVVGKVAKILGPRGLMPNPKLQTVTMDVAMAVKAAKAGQFEYRTDKGGKVDIGVGKLSFSEGQLKENIASFISMIAKSRPAGVKGTFIKKICLSSTMGVGLKVDLGSCQQ